jgi:ABC transporter DrrB family efflux protein
MLVRYIRYPHLVAVAIIQPLLIVFLFRYVFGGAIGVTGTSYVEYLFPGIFALVIVQGSGNTGIGLAEDVHSGVLERFRSLPVSRASILLARTVADLAKNMITLLLIGVVAIAVGFHFATGYAHVLAAFGLSLAFGVAMAWLSFAVTMLLGTAEAVQGALLIFTLTATFVSDTFVPASTMPGWLQIPVEASPVSRLVDALRGQTIGVGSASVTATLIWVACLLAVTVPVTIRLYRRA